jgi:hypothetical protein
MKMKEKRGENEEKMKWKGRREVEAPKLRRGGRNLLRG